MRGKQKGTPTEQVNLRLPVDLIDRIRTRLRDPLRNKTQYGSVSQLIASLLYEWDGRADKTLDDI